MILYKIKIAGKTIESLKLKPSAKLHKKIKINKHNKTKKDSNFSDILKRNKFFLNIYFFRITK